MNSNTQPAALPSDSTEQERAMQLIERIVRECPRRKPTSEDERRSQEMVREEFTRLGLATEEHAFQFNDNLYANLMLHFGLGTLGTLVSGVAPLAGLGLHLLAGTSYLADSARRGYLLRRLLGFKRSQNVLGTLPAEGKPKLRVVLAGHADAAFTGLLFDPRMVRLVSRHRLPGMFERSVAMVTFSQFLLAGFDVANLVLGPWPLLLIAQFICSIPTILTFLFGLDAVVRNRIVPGANDDLSGVAALPVLASRFARVKPPEVEMVFVATGCEEASLGGADALARDKLRSGEWSTKDTVFIALDGLTNGDLCYLDGDGEVLLKPVPPWLVKLAEQTKRTDPRFAQVRPFQTPVGGTDAAAFLAHGYDAIGLVCVDHQIGSPRHYHQPTDTPENLDPEQLMQSIDFAEQLVHGIIAERTAG